MRKAAHDLSSLLTVVGGYCELAEQSIAAGERSLAAAAKNLALVKQAHVRCCEIVQDVQRSRLQAEGHFDLNAIVREIAEVLRAGMMGANVQVQVQQQIEEELLIEGDSLVMFRALMNLCLNARNAMAASGGRLQIRTESDGEFAALRVSDSGTGMSAEMLARVWDQPVSADGKHGHGLQIVQGAIANLGGTITATSQPEIGTVFTIVLPLADSRTGTGTKAA